MDHRLERKKQDSAGIEQGRLLISLKNITAQIIKVLEQDYFVDNFILEQRDKLIHAVKLSESVHGPIGADEKNGLMDLQNQLEQLLLKRINESTSNIVDYTSKTRDFKKYNLKNVR